MITADELAIILPCPAPRAIIWATHINAVLERFEINTPLRAASFIAQVGHESGGLKFMREIWNPAQCAWQLKYESSINLGNTKADAIGIAAAHHSSPGYWWRGGGLMQVTGYNNYKNCGAALGLDLLNNPELIEIPEHAAASSGWFWQTGAGFNLGKAALQALSQYGMGEGCDLNDVADLNDFKTLTICINGGTNGYPDRLAIFNRALGILQE